MPSIEIHKVLIKAEDVESYLRGRGFLVYRYKLPQTGCEYILARRVY